MPENIFYLARRAAAALFTRRCVCCKRAFSGRLCICESCAKTLVPAKRISGYGFEAYSAYAYCGAAREAMLRFKFSENGGICMDTLSDWLCEAFDRCLSERSFDFVVGVPAFNSIESKAELLAKDFARRRSLRTAFPPKSAKLTLSEHFTPLQKQTISEFCLSMTFLQRAAPQANVFPHFLRRAQERFACSRY